MTEKWASDRKITLPFVVDPSGALAAKIEADRSMGARIPLDHTPTIYIINESGHGPSVTELSDINLLYQTLDGVMKEAGTTTQAHKTAASH